MKLAVLTDTTQTGDVFDTDYGPSAPIHTLALAGSEVLVTAPTHADPRALVRTLKDHDVTHLWLCESVGALSPLLDADGGDWLVPDDFIDGTRGQHYTYFSEKAGGYVQQVPPFDPASREALLAGAANVSPRPFKRGVYVCVSNTRLETPAEAAFWSRAGGHVVGRFLSPYLALAREVEMQVAALVAVVRPGGAVGESLSFERYVPALSTAIGQMGG